MHNTRLQAARPARTLHRTVQICMQNTPLAAGCGGAFCSSTPHDSTFQRSNYMRNMPAAVDCGGASCSSCTYHNTCGRSGYMRKTPNAVCRGGALSAAASASPSTRRVSAGSITPSSHSRADANSGAPSRSYLAPNVVGGRGRGWAACTHGSRAFAPQHPTSAQACGL